MNKFVKKYRKQVLAIFSVGLMIAFFATPSARKQFVGQPNIVVGSIDGEKLYSDEMRQAKAEWDKLRSVLAKNSRGMPVSYMVLGPLAFQQINEHPDMFFLLKKEAQRLGVGVTKDDLETFVQNYVDDIGDEDEEHAQQIHQAVHSLLLVQAGYQRGASVIKVSDPLRRHAMAQQTQTISLNLVPFQSADFAQKVATPTTQQLQDQFNRFADVTAGTIDPRNNPFAFGYRYPNRVKLHYIAISRPEVRKAVQASKTPYDWEVAAIKYYQQHQNEFPTTQPATANPISLASNPTTKPFAEVEKDAINSVINPEVERKMEAMQTRIAAALGADWMAYHNKIDAGATRPASPVNSSMGVPYDSLDYLKNLAAAVQKEFGVLPIVASAADTFKSAADLKALPYIGSSTLDMVSFPDYVTNRAEAFVPADQKESADVLSLMKPSAPFQDELHSVYFFRLTDVSPAHRPASMEEVAATVRADYLAAAQYDLAKAAARALLDAAAKSSLAAASGDRRVITTGFFKFDPETDISGYSVPPDLRGRFMAQAFELLSTAATQPSGKRLSLIELPHAGSITVAELADVKSIIDANPAQVASYIAHQMTSVYEREFQSHWYTYDGVVSRLKYRAEKKSDS